MVNTTVPRVLKRLGYDSKEIQEMDLNPVIAYPRGLAVVDARILLRRTKPSVSGVAMPKRARVSAAR